MQSLVSETIPATPTLSLAQISAARCSSGTFMRQSGFIGMISNCPQMNKVFSILERVGPTNSTALILGESGTGKELIAKALHKLSQRSGRLVPVNCGAIPEEILESELFGHEKGAFTGAINSRIGRFQMADGGTIFLDEIAEMSPKLQVKLLRVLQERRVEPVGSTRSIDIDVRVIAATNKDLREEVRAGRFREDLFYRLQVVPILLPALRERGEDAKILAQHFLSRCAEQQSRPGLCFSEQALARLGAYPWPGNIRELENLVERLAILSENDLIEPSELPDYIRAGATQEPYFAELGSSIPADGLDFNAMVSSFENRLIEMALGQTSGNKKAAARLLRLNRTTLVEKIKKKGIEGQVEVFVESETESSDRPFVD